MRQEKPEVRVYPNNGTSLYPISIEIGESTAIYPVFECLEPAYRPGRYVFYDGVLWRIEDTNACAMDPQD